MKQQQPTLEDLKKELNEPTLFVDYDEPDYNDKTYGIYYYSNDENGQIKEFSGWVKAFDGIIKEQE